MNKMALITVITLFACVLLFFLVLWKNSPGKPSPLLDEAGKTVAGSISEKIFVPIGGIRQGMFIRSKDLQNPVLLYLHGGPSFPNYFLVEQYQPRLEEYFTVCYWEQRGGGLSYHADIPSESMTFDQLTSDAFEVTNYLRKRFGKEKIYLMAHSGGTVIGIKAVARAPQLFHAYIAMAQVTRQAESEKIALRYMTDEYTNRGNQKLVQQLAPYTACESDSCLKTFFRSGLRDKTMHELGIGTMRTMLSVIRGVFIPSWFCHTYTLPEKLKMWKSKFSLLPRAKFVDELFELNIPLTFPKLEVPVYFLSGRHDLTVNYLLAKDYFEKLEAPLKGFYTFEKSAHSPLFEEPDRVRAIFEQDILHNKNGMSDELNSANSPA